ncbi:hypothetical protein [Bacteroides sedimenti]|uniref:CBM-cenC domain-containing protein n=1 Tax=Bacteroides sedimenti TaxID=2136147 RepID=A0ABM8IBH2_9BACE
MKKITLMKKCVLALVLGFCGVLSLNAQNLITVNSGFEDWAGGAPTGYTPTTPTGATISQESTIKAEGNSSLKINHAGSSGTGKMVYNIKVPVEAGKYTFSFKYYVDPTSGTASVLRHWGYMNDVNGAIPAATDPNIAQYNAISTMLQTNGGTTSGYLDTSVTGTWQTSETELDIPFAGTLQLEIRYYKTFVGYIDALSLVKNTSSGLVTEQLSASIYSNAGKVFVNANVGDKIVVTNSLGQVVRVIVAHSGMNELADLPQKQLLIVKAGSKIAKVIL